MAKKTLIHGGQIKDQTIGISQIQKNAIDNTLIKDYTITDVNIAIDAAINADKLVDGTKNKFFTTTEQTKLAIIEFGANYYVHPETHSASMIVETADRCFVTLKEKEVLTSLVEDLVANYVHNQDISSKEWIIDHNMSKYPSVSIVDTAGSLVMGDVEYKSNQQIIIKFGAAFSGKVFLN